jgi:hypothetical protein
LFGNGDRLLQVLQRSNYEAIVRQIFPEEWVRNQADELIDQFWAYFNFQSPQLRLVADFRPVKARLEGAQAAQISASIVEGFPPCQKDEILNWGLQALQGQVNNLPLCRPPDQLLGAANLLVEGSLKGASAAMPDGLDVVPLLKMPFVLGGHPVSSAWTTAFGVYHFYRQVNPWLPLVALGLLALVGFMARGTLRGPLYWLGIGLVLPGVTALIVALLLGLASSQIVPLIIGRVFGENLVVFNLLVGMLANVLGRFMLTSAAIALGVTLVGAVLIGITLRRR